MNKPNSLYFENLDALRFFAFLLVFIRHYFDFSLYEPSAGLEALLLKNFAMNGRLGVNLFFVLSGFLITYLLIAEKQNKGKIQINYFYYRRILRIWPLYFLIIFLCFFIVPLLTHRFSAATIKEHLLYYVFFINNFDILNTGFVGVGDDGLAILWSIAVEEQFYLVWPVLLLIVNKKHFSKLFILVIILSVIFRLVHVGNKFIIYFHTFSVMSDLAVGGFLAWAAFYKTNFITFIANLKRNHVIFVYFVLLVAMTFHEEWAQFNTFTRVFERLILSMLFAFVIAEQCFCTHSFFKFGKLKVAGKLGIISYGLYCLHLFSIALVQKMNILLHFDQKSPFVFYLEFPLTLLIAVLASYLCYHYFEKIFLNLKSKFSVV